MTVWEDRREVEGALCDAGRAAGAGLRWVAQTS